MKKIGLIAIVIIVAAGAWYLLFGFGKSDRSAGDFATRIVLPKRDNLRVSINSTGKVEPVKTVEVKSKASGEVIELNFETGDYVERGQLLCRIDPEQVQFEYNKAVADLAVAKANLQTTEREVSRQKQLFEQGLISESQMDAATLQLEQSKAQLVRAEAAVSDAKKRLDDTVVRAPISGLILRCDIEEGNIIASGVSTVTGGTLLMEIAQVDSVYIVAAVDETDIGKVELGQRVEVEADAFADEIFYGEVLKVAPVARVEQNVTVFEVTTKVDNHERKLKRGMNANVEIITAYAENALLVPNAAVKDPRRLGLMGEMAQQPEEGARPPTPGNPEMAQRFGQRFQDRQQPDKSLRIVLVQENGELTPRRVVVGANNLDYTQILEGLSETDSVDATPVSRMMQDREAFRQRMSSRFSSVPGMRRQ